MTHGHSSARATALVILALALTIGAACSAYHPPTVTRDTIEHLDASRKLFVLADRKREPIVAALERAGFAVTTDARELGYSVTVRVGTERGRGDCGPVHNVVYTVVRLGKTLLEIKGRGGTGDCDANIFDEVAALMARYRIESESRAVLNELTSQYATPGAIQSNSRSRTARPTARPTSVE